MSGRWKRILALGASGCFVSYSSSSNGQSVSLEGDMYAGGVCRSHPGGFPIRTADFITFTATALRMNRSTMPQI